MQSEKIEQISQALSKVQSALRPTEKSGSNSAFGAPRKYLTLTDVWDAIREPLAEHKLSVVQGVNPVPGSETPVLFTLLMHESGQWIRSEMPLLLAKKDPQGVGAAMTYYRRYSLAAMVGVVQDDDDAQGAMPERQNQRQQAQPQRQRPVPEQRPAQASAPSQAGAAAALSASEDVLFQHHRTAIEGAKNTVDLTKAWGFASAAGLTPVKLETLRSLANTRKTALTPKPAPAQAAA